jgi:hypothetical protein
MATLPIAVLFLVGSLAGDQARQFRLASFSADVTIPIGHRCMGVLPIKARQVVDPLEAHGLVLLGADRPIVLAAVDWCEIRNASYDEWREALARAAGTSRERVLVACLHQHDAPVVDGEAQALLDRVGLKGELFDTGFHARCIARVAAALRRSMNSPRPITHLGFGKAKVEKVASNRRVVDANGVVRFSRSSASAGKPLYRDAPEGEIDPYLRTISFWDGDTPILALHAYATHPMSYYGRGGVSADFVGLARRLRYRDDPKITQIYVSGCSGDVTAGKYNDGSREMRTVLADRLLHAMRTAWHETTRIPLRNVAFRSAPLELPFHDGPAFEEKALLRLLHDDSAKATDRILAAMGLSSRNRVARGQAIDLPCIDLGSAQIVLFPGESFVGYQLLAQKLREDSFVLSIGYGECWPGYIPTDAAVADRFDEGWRWVADGCEFRIRQALVQVLAPPSGKRPPDSTRRN